MNESQVKDVIFEAIETSLGACEPEGSHAAPNLLAGRRRRPAKAGEENPSACPAGRHDAKIVAIGRNLLD